MIYLSASQLDTAALCRRKRHFQSVMRLPTLKKNYQTFGTVMHGICERYLTATPTGRDNRGRPVELFPEHWEVVALLDTPKIEKGTKRQYIKSEEVVFCDLEEGQIDYVVGILTLTPHEQALARTLFQQAVEAGVIERRPGGKAEEKFQFPIQLEANGVEATALLTGYLDYGDWTSVQDHKTSKGRRYLKSKKKLSKDIQMMLYAAHKLMTIRQRGLREPPFIELRHNQFIKGRFDDFGNMVEDPGTRKTEAKVTPAQVVAYWNDVIMPLAQQCAIDELTVQDPFELPDPAPGACGAFGGCPYLNLCTGRESIARYKNRVDKYNKNAKENRDMSEALNKLLAKQQQNKAGAVPAAAAPGTAQVNPAPRPAVTRHIRPASEVYAEGQAKRQGIAAPVAAAAAPRRVVVQEEEVQEEVAEVAIPPWAKHTANGDPEDCAACGTGESPGFNTKGNICRICQQYGKDTQDPNRDTKNWNIQVDDGGNFSWDPKEAEEEAPAPAPVAGKTKRVSPAPSEIREEIAPAEEEVAPPPVRRGPGRPPGAKNKKTLEKEAAANGTAPQAPAAPRPQAKTPAAVPVTSREKFQFMLLIGCAPLTPRENIVTVEEILNSLQVGEQTYHDVEDVWGRRGWLTNNANEIAESLIDCVVVQTVGNPDGDALVSALLPLAELVIRGSR